MKVSKRVAAEIEIGILELGANLDLLNPADRKIVVQWLHVAMRFPLQCFISCW
jgi:hypothetical protein